MNKRQTVLTALNDPKNAGLSSRELAEKLRVSKSYTARLMLDHGAHKAASTTEEPFVGTSQAPSRWTKGQAYQSFGAQQAAVLEALSDDRMASMDDTRLAAHLKVSHTMVTRLRQRVNGTPGGV